MRRGEVLVDLDCSAVHRLSLRHGLPRAAARQFARVQPGLVRLEVCGTALAQPPLLALGQLDRQCTHDLLHHLVLGCEDISEIAIKPIGLGYASSLCFSAREKAALHYADLFKQGEHAIDKDQVYADLAKHFSDEEIIELGLFCAEVDGVGKFVKSLNVLSWEEACELNPKLKSGLAQVAAE